MRSKHVALAFRIHVRVKSSGDSHRRWTAEIDYAIERSAADLDQVFQSILISYRGSRSSFRLSDETLGLFRHRKRLRSESVLAFRLQSAEPPGFGGSEDFSKKYEPDRSDLSDCSAYG